MARDNMRSSEMVQMGFSARGPGGLSAKNGAETIRKTSGERVKNGGVAQFQGTTR